MVSPPNSNTRAVLNPAIGLMSPLVSLFEGNTDPMKWFWIYLSFPFVGSLVGVFFHEFVYKKIQASIERTESQSGDDEDRAYDTDGALLDHNNENKVRDAT